MRAPEFIRQLLTTLLIKADKTPDKKVRIGANEKCMQPYIHNEPLGITTATNEGLKHLCDMIAIKWRNPGVLIQYIELIDADRLARELGYIRLESRAFNAYKIVESALINSHNFEELKIDLAEQWSKTGNYEGFSVDDPTVFIDAVRAADEMITQSAHGSEIDERHFSSRVFSDSKRLKSIRGKVAKIAKLTNPDLPNELSPEEVLRLFGVVPIKHPIYVSGPISVEAFNNKTVSADFPPCIGIWPDFVQQLYIESPIEIITTIENQATFMRYLEQEKQSNELVLYTAGMPSPALLRFYKLSVQMGLDIELRHWGDIDVGGFTILNIIEKHAGRDVAAYRMMPESYTSESSSVHMTTSEKKQLLKLASGLSDGNKKCAIYASEVGQKFEQEWFY